MRYGSVLLLFILKQGRRNFGQLLGIYRDLSDLKRIFIKFICENAD